MNRKQNLEVFAKTPVRKAVLLQIVPAVASQMVTLVYNLADTYFVGMLNAPHETAAVTVAYPSFLMLTAISNLFGVGGASAIARALGRIRGSYALAVMFQDYPGEIYVARKDSPMIIGVENGDCYVASDVPAILKYTRNVYYIGNLEMARLANGTVTFYNLDGDEIEKKPTQIKWDAEAAEKAGYEHFIRHWGLSP